MESFGDRDDDILDKKKGNKEKEGKKVDKKTVEKQQKEEENTQKRAENLDSQKKIFENTEKAEGQKILQQEATAMFAVGYSQLKLVGNGESQYGDKLIKARDDFDVEMDIANAFNGDPKEKKERILEAYGRYIKVINDVNLAINKQIGEKDEKFNKSSTEQKEIYLKLNKAFKEKISIIRTALEDVEFYKETRSKLKSLREEIESSTPKEKPAENPKKAAKSTNNKTM